jgi:hypothetical protein
MKTICTFGLGQLIHMAEKANFLSPHKSMAGYKEQFTPTLQQYCRGHQLSNPLVISALVLNGLRISFISEFPLESTVG